MTFVRAGPNIAQIRGATSHLAGSSDPALDRRDQGGQVGDPGRGKLSLFERNLDRNAANTAPLTPLDFLRRAAAVYPDKIAVIHGSQRTTYRELYARSCRLASALIARGIGRGDTVAIVAPNTPAMLEAHYGVPMAGAVLNPLNIRLDPATIAFVLEHGGAKALLVDREFSEVVHATLARVEKPPLVVDIDDALAESGGMIGALDYEALLAEGDPDADAGEPADEWQTISLLYTSGTTGSPKGAAYHHRGAYLNAFGNMITFGLVLDSVYLWTLPMFHCDGWTFTWAVTAACATHVCLRKVGAGPGFRIDRRARGDPHVRRADRAQRARQRAGQGQDRLRTRGRNRDRRCRAAECGDRGHGERRLPGHPPLRPDRMLRAGHGLRLAAGLGELESSRTRRQAGAPGCALPNSRSDPGRRSGERGGTALGRDFIGRDHVARQYRDEGLYQEPERHRGGFRRGLVPHRRSGGAPPGRLYRGQGPAPRT